MDHPCNLTKTTVRISFPELKGEVFVNLLGYKEPNLIPLWRCKGKTTFKSTKLEQKLEKVLLLIRFVLKRCLWRHREPNCLYCYQGQTEEGPNVCQDSSLWKKFQRKAQGADS